MLERKLTFIYFVFSFSHSVQCPSYGGHFGLSQIRFGEGNGHPLQYSCLENPMDRGAWQSMVHKVAQSRTQLKRLSTCPTLCDPIACSPPASSVHGILQARILKWVAIPFSRGSSQPRYQTCVSYIYLNWQADSLPLAPITEY